MYSEPGKVVFTGLVIGAVAIGTYAYVSQSEDDWSPADELGLARGDETARGDIMSGAITRAPITSRSNSVASEADRLHAARKSLLRDDVAAARAQPNVARPARQNDDAVAALKKQAQMDKEQRALAASQADKVARPVEKMARTSSSSMVKSAQSRDSRFAARESSKRAPSSYSKSGRASETATVVAGSYSASSRNVSTASALPGASQPAYAPPAMKVVASAPASLNAPITPIAPMEPLASAPLQQLELTVQPALSKPQAELTAQTIMSPPLVQSMPVGGVLPKLDGGPKTRAQVRAEIVRARADGSLPAFGNPDPAGPGGAPSLTGALRP